MRRTALVAVIAVLFAGVPGAVFPGPAGPQDDTFLRSEPQDLDQGRIVPCCFSQKGGSKPDSCQLVRRWRCYRLGGTVVDGCFKCPIWDFGGPKLGE